jgi:polygalacturonase
MNSYTCPTPLTPPVARTLSVCLAASLAWLSGCSSSPSATSTASATASSAQVSSRPTATSFDVRTYGATGDGKTLDTAAINKAIEAAASAGGGTVRFPAGNYLSYSIHLKSNITLFLEAGSVIVGADSPAGGGPNAYDPPEANPAEFYQDFGHNHWHNSLIWGEDLQNVTIEGPGMIFGRGLTSGGKQKSPLPGEPRPPRIEPSEEEKRTIIPGPFKYPSPGDNLPSGLGNKAIALKNCRNVTLRDFTIFHGGHFGVLATGVDNFTLDNLKIDTNRDGMDIDCCRNVRVSNCSVNSPNDDGICPKSSFALGYNRPTENLTITNCYVSGYVEGTLIDGTRKRESGRGHPTGRIKLGTEGNGGFKNITISNCVFEYCRGLALEEVDGGPMEDIAITNITMRDIQNAPIFVRLGARLRGPEGTAMGTARRIKISNIVAYNTLFEQGILISGVPGTPIEDLTLSNIFIHFEGGGLAEHAARDVPEKEKDYPEPRNFGILPAYGLFARHVKNFQVDRIEFRYGKNELRPAIHLEDIDRAELEHVRAPHATDSATIVLKDVTGLTIRNSPGLPDSVRTEKISAEKL